MRNIIPSWIRVPIAFFVIFGVVEYFIDSGSKPAFIEFPAVSLFLLLVLLILIAIEAIIGALENVMLHKLDEKARAKFLEEKEKTIKFTWFKKIYNKLTDRKPIEEEHEIILDHNYDGIKELDNSLPPWWLYGFYATIIFGFVYMARYHVFNGDNQYDELQEELAQAKLDIEEYKSNAKDLVDFNTVEVLTDASDIKAGKAIYESTCVACHMADGGGGIGPNLTDNYWIMGGDIKHIFKTVSEGGRSGKGMIAWKTQLKPAQIAQVASYVLTLQGTTPANPKDPEGEIWVADGEETPLEKRLEQDVITIDTTGILNN